jgi:Oxidoreductase molybdopterin binding domain
LFSPPVAEHPRGETGTAGPSLADDQRHDRSVPRAADLDRRALLRGGVPHEQRDEQDANSVWVDSADQ